MNFKTILVLVFCFLPQLCQAAEPGVVINEIAWMGTENSANDEWIELYNSSETETNLDGWLLKSADDTPKINLQGKIPGKGFFLLERTDDQTVPEITADLIYVGALNNNGEKLRLIDSQGGLIDEIDCSIGWLSGDNASKQTMERKNLTGWQTSAEPGGTPKQINTQLTTSPVIPSDSEESRPSETPEQQDTGDSSAAPPLQNDNEPPASITDALPEIQPSLPQPIKYPSNVFINEILPSPQGADTEQEWIEIYNSNDFEVDLNGWQIRDTVGQSRTYICPTASKIAPQGFLLLPRTDTKITLQNSGDTLELLNPNGEIVHQANYPKAPIGQSYNRTPADWQWSTTVTAGKENIISQPLPSQSSPSENWEDKATQKTGTKNQGPTSTVLTAANIQKELPASSRRLLTLFLAVIIAIGSVIIVLFLKKNPPTQ